MNSTCSKPCDFSFPSEGCLPVSPFSAFFFFRKPSYNFSHGTSEVVLCVPNHYGCAVLHSWGSFLAPYYTTGESGWNKKDGAFASKKYHLLLRARGFSA